MVLSHREKTTKTTSVENAYECEKQFKIIILTWVFLNAVV